MSGDVAQQRGPSRKALASVFLGVACLGVGVSNTRPVTEVGFGIALVAGFLSLGLAVLALRDIWRSRGGLHGMPLALAGAGVALLGMLLSQGFRGLQKATDRQMEVATHLKRLTVTLLAYEKENGTLPPAAVQGKDGKGLLSWRVLVLPYLEREGWAENGLSQQFRLDEPWDSPHNLPLLARMPRVYAPPAGLKTPEPHSTYYRVLVGRGAAFEGERGLRPEDFPDGAGETLLVVEAAEAVPWTKPEELVYAADRPLPRLGFLSKVCFYAGFANGSLHAIRQKAGEQSIRALITRDGGDDPGPNWEFTGLGSEDR